MEENKIEFTEEELAFPKKKQKTTVDKMITLPKKIIPSIDRLCLERNKRISALFCDLITEEVDRADNKNIEQKGAIEVSRLTQNDMFQIHKIMKAFNDWTTEIHEMRKKAWDLESETAEIKKAAAELNINSIARNIHERLLEDLGSELKEVKNIKKEIEDKKNITPNNPIDELDYKEMYQRAMVEKGDYQNQITSLNTKMSELSKIRDRYKTERDNYKRAIDNHNNKTVPMGKIEL